MTTEDTPPDEPATKKSAESDFDKDLKKGPLSPTNEELFNFLDSLFTGEGEFPEKIEVRLVKGRNKDQYGRSVKQIIYKSGSVKPSRERIVMMSNDFLLRMKQETDVMKRETTFMVGAMHHGRNDDYFEIMTLEIKPSKRWRGSGENGHEVDDDDSDIPFSERYNTTLLGEHSKLFALLGGMVEGLIDRSDRQAQAAANEADRLRVKYIELLEANLKLVQADDERQEKRAWNQFKRENFSKGMDMAWGLLPPMMLSAFTGKNGANGAAAAWQEGSESPEAYTLREFFKMEGGKFSKEQFEVIFGNVSADGQKIISAGILSEGQARLLVGIATKSIDPSRLDDLLPEGPLEIKKEQIFAIMKAGIPVEVIAPLKTLLDVRLAKRAEREQAAAQQQQQPTP